MKKLIVLFSIFTLLFACKSENKESKVPDTTEIKSKLDESYSSFGEKISDKNLLSKKETSQNWSWSLTNTTRLSFFSLISKNSLG